MEDGPLVRISRLQSEAPDRPPLIPEKYLLQGVLARAFYDATGGQEDHKDRRYPSFGSITVTQLQYRLYTLQGKILDMNDALSWFNSTNREARISFISVCEHLDLDPEEVRAIAKRKAEESRAEIQAQMQLVLDKLKERGHVGTARRPPGRCHTRGLV